MKLSQSNKKSIDLIIPSILGSIVFFTGYKANKNDFRTNGINTLIVVVIAYLLTSQITKTIVSNTIDKVSAKDEDELKGTYGATDRDLRLAETIASEVYAALRGSSWSEDEARAVSALKRVTSASMARLVSEVYNRNYSYSLKSDVNSYIHIWDGYYDIPVFVRENIF